MFLEEAPGTLLYYFNAAARSSSQADTSPNLVQLMPCMRPWTRKAARAYCVSTVYVLWCIYYTLVWGLYQKERVVFSFFSAYGWSQLITFFAVEPTLLYVMVRARARARVSVGHTRRRTLAPDLPPPYPPALIQPPPSFPSLLSARLFRDRMAGDTPILSLDSSRGHAAHGRDAG